MRNKGFTLIELLAVIVILAIIALISAPVVLNIISDSKKSANERSVELYVQAINNSIASSIMNSPNTIISNDKYTITEEGLCNQQTNVSDNKIHCSSDAIKILAENTDKMTGRVWIGNNAVTNYEITIDGTVFSKSDATCFEFNSNTQTITGYKADCPKGVIIPSEINSVKVLKIGNEAFGSKNLTNVEIPEGIEEIGGGAFHNNSLTIVTIPSTVTTIGEQAFFLNNLERVVIEGKTSGQLDVTNVFKWTSGKSNDDIEWNG